MEGGHHSSSAANLQAGFSGAGAGPGQPGQQPLPRRAGSEGLTFPRMFSPAPDLERPQPRPPQQLPPGSSGLFGQGANAFASTLWPQTHGQGQNGISGTHQMWG